MKWDIPTFRVVGHYIFTFSGPHRTRPHAHEATGVHEILTYELPVAVPHIEGFDGGDSNLRSRRGIRIRWVLQAGCQQNLADCQPALPTPCQRPVLSPFVWGQREQAIR